MTPNSSLLQWLATFQLDGKSAVEVLEKDAYYNLADGYVCARILNQISSPYFTDKWLEGIKPVPPNGSWRLRVSNLKRILQKIHDYASDLQSPQFRPPSDISPDVTVIAQNFDPDQICRLIQLILFCAINCNKKQDYIEKIRDLPTEVKQDIKEAIEELLIKNNDSSKINTNRSRNDSIHSESEAANSGQRFNISTSSQTANLSPARSSNYRSGGALRRDSSQSDSHRRNESHVDISQSYINDQNETVEEVRQKLSAAMAIKDEKAQACHELELKLKQLQMERDQLAYENEMLLGEKNTTPIKFIESRRLQARNSTDNEDAERRFRNIENEQSRDLALQQNKRLQTDVQRLKEEIMKIEAEKEDYRLKSNLLKEDLDRITMKHEELRNKAEQAKRLQDELDEHKHISEKVVSYEAMMENLVKKNNEMKRELKSLEEKNLAHIQTIVKLEEQNQQLTNTVNQIELYKKQLNEARIKLSQETHRADKAEVELVRLSEKFAATKKDYDRLFEATNHLMRGGISDDRKNDTFSQSRIFESVNLKDGSPSNQIYRTGDENFEGQQQDALNSISTTSVIELKERIARLEMENELLQTKVNSKQESNKSVLNKLLEEATDKCKRLENENRQSRKKIMMLESNLKDLIGGGGGGGQPSTSGAILPQDSSSDNVLALIKRVEDLQRSLYQREQELRDAEAKYKKNIQKAKDVIKALNNNQSTGGSLHPSCVSSASSFNSSSLDETNLLRQQLREKEECLIELEREFYEFKKLKEVHERLILSAFYGLTTPMQWKNAEKRLERTTITSPPNTASSSINVNSKHNH